MVRWNSASSDLEQLKERVEALKEAVKNDAFYTTDEDGLRKEKASGDDVAQVRTSTVSDSDPVQQPESASQTDSDGECTEPLMGQTYIANRGSQQGGPGSSTLKHTFEAASELLNMPPTAPWSDEKEPDQRAKIPTSSRESEPLNEF